MKAKVKAILSPDVENLLTYNPESNENFALFLQLLIGLDGEEGMESFQVTVCTPLWLASNFKKTDIVVGCHYLIVQEYNYERLIGFINSYVESITGLDWNNISQKLVKFGYWEFEDYQPYNGQFD